MPKLPKEPPELLGLLELGPAALKQWGVPHHTTQDGRYLHWDDLRFRDPPSDLSHEEWWTLIRFSRLQLAKRLPLLDTQGRQFTFVRTDKLLETLQTIDRDLAGHVGSVERLVPPGQRYRYLFSSIVEEAITSSQLEGAAVTRRVAKDMIRSGRRPRDTSERMVLNNYRAMERIRELRDERLTPALVRELHRIVTENTLDDPADAGRLQEPGEKRAFMSDGLDRTVLHYPPPADELPERLEMMCRFANGDTDEGFIHPVVRAIALHFWIAYDHYFVDGNGRVARSVFYWSMLAQGYWLAEYTSISSILRKAPAKYGRAFLLTETDRSDMTYFILHQLDVLSRAVAELHSYLDRKASEVRRTEAMLRDSATFNHRQLALLSHALRHPGHVYTIAGHAASHRVVYQTARTDLLDLSDRRLLDRRKRGKKYEFTVVPDLEHVLRGPDD